MSMAEPSSNVDLLKTEKLAAARRKLKEFESRKQQNSSPTSSSSYQCEQPNGRQSTNSICSELDSHSHDHQTNGHRSLNSAVGMAEVHALLNAKTVECESVKTQLADLHGHYTQLHAAYSRLSEQSSTPDQVVQLQSAFSVLVEEKTALQSDLRKANDTIHELQKQLEGISKAGAEYSTDVNKRWREVEELQKALHDAERLLSGRLEELNASRRDAAAYQSSARQLQQDKSEVQARLRSVYKEKEQLEEQLKEARKEVHMKDIHIKQLTAHGNTASSIEDVHTLNDQVESLRAQCVDLSEQLQLSKRETEEANERFNLYGKQLNESYSKLSLEFDQVSAANFNANSRVAQLESELELTKGEVERLRRTQLGEQPTQIGASEEDILRRIDEEVRRVSDSFEKRITYDAELHANELDAKEKEIISREQELGELRLKVSVLEERQAERDSQSTDLSSVLTELQNEKAAVSRAVAQNKELKEQLIDLEDRLVALTNEKLNSELARQAVEHQLNVLTCQDEEDGGDSRRLLEEQLAETTRQLNEVRADLRRSHTQNEEMNRIMRQNAEDENQNTIHVELEQAVNRVHVLAQENEQLREELSRRPPAVLPLPDGTGERTSREEMTFLTLENEKLAIELQRATDEKNRVAEKIHTLESQVRRLEEQHIVHEVIEQRKSPSEKYEGAADAEWVRRELEEKVKQLIGRVANLEDLKSRLEHVNVQLQLENETIADHVVLYQHQRRLIRERLKIKDQQLAAAEEERIRVSKRCEEMTNVLQHILGQERVAAVGDRSPRSRSLSQVNEEEGGEELVIDEETPFEPVQKDVAVQRIMDILADLRSAPTLYDGNVMKCTQCVGETLVV